MFTCDVCGMTTNHKDTLMRHKRGHNKANQVTCDLCGKICHHRIALREVSTTLKQRRYLIDRAISFWSFWLATKAILKPLKVNIKEKSMRKMLFAISVTRTGFWNYRYHFLYVLVNHFLSIKRHSMWTSSWSRTWFTTTGTNESINVLTAPRNLFDMGTNCGT